MFRPGLHSEDRPNLLGMANYSGTARTNYFQVKGEDAFRAWAAAHNRCVIQSAGGFGLLPPVMSDDGCFSLHDEATDTEPDIADEIAAHLAPDSIAVVMKAGHEKSRYISGWAVAINHLGERVQLDLRDIYGLAANAFGIAPTRAES